MPPETLSVNGKHGHGTVNNPNVLGSLDAWRARTAKSRPIVPVPIPELADGEEEEPIVLLRAMSDSLREDWAFSQIGNLPTDEELRKQVEQRRTIGEVNRGQRALLVALSVVDAAGELLFSEDDVRELQKLNARAILRLYGVALAINGLLNDVNRAQFPPDILAWLARYEARAEGRDLVERVGN